MRILTIVLALALVQITSGIAWPQDAGQEQQQPLLGAAQLDQLVAPIALYPDPLLAQVLMASTYPLEVVQADRFAKTNKALKGDKLTQALDKQDWDASVKQLVSTPTVLAMMSDQLDWTEKLGDAVLAQQTDLMDAIQRLRGQAQANGKLGTTKQQKVTVSQEANKQVIEIEPASPEVAYVPYYNPSVVYGEWSYPDYPPYYYPPPAGYVVGGAIATGLAWGAAFAIGHQIWDNFDWNRGNINVNIDRNVNRNIDRNVNRNVDRNFQKWEHNSYHRRGVSYNSDAVKNKFSKGNARAAADRKLDYRGRKGDQVLNVGQGGQLGGGNRGERPNVGQGGQLGGGNRGERPNVGQGGQLGGGNRGERPTTKPSVGQLEQGLKDRSGKPKGKAAAKAKGGGGGNALDLRDGARAKDFSDRGKASLGNRGTKDFSRPSGGGPKSRSLGRWWRTQCQPWWWKSTSGQPWRRWRTQSQPWWRKSTSRQPWRWWRRPYQPRRWWTRRRRRRTRRRRTRRRRATFGHQSQAGHRSACAARQRSRTLSLPLQGRRSHDLCGRHGAGRAEDRTERSLARTRRIFAGRL